MTTRARYKTIEFWIAVLSAAVAIGLVSMDAPINEYARTIVGVITIITALVARTRE